MHRCDHFAVPLTLPPFWRLSMPVIVGQLIAGILVVQSSSGIVHQGGQLLYVLSFFSFACLMICSGLEIDFSKAGTLGFIRSVQK